MEQPLSRANEEQNPNFSLCPSCKAYMPREMRFCRACGYRLGEGVAEFNETVRLPGAPSTQRPNPGGATFAGGPGTVHEFGGIATAQNGQPYFDNSNQYGSWSPPRRRRRRFHWILWVALIAGISGASSGGLRSLFPRFNRPPAFATAPHSMLGVTGLMTTPQGASFDSVSPPGSPVDKAGLVGGDIVTSLDGQAVKTSDDLQRILAAIPIGKTVDINYLRDGEPKTTKLTTASDDEIDGLTAAFAALPKGFLGIDDMKSVPVSGTNLKGVLVRTVNENYPAYIAGIQSNDIIVEFDGVPIRTQAELTSRIRRTLPKKQVTVGVIRGGQRIDIPMTVGTR